MFLFPIEALTSYKELINAHTCLNAFARDGKARSLVEDSGKEEEEIEGD